MARLSKTHQFTIFDDAGIPTPECTVETAQDDYLAVRCGPQKGVEVIDYGRKEDDAQSLEVVQDADNNANDADDERRQSSHSATSVSTMPESTYQTNHDIANAIQIPYTPPVIRPSFRRPESVRKMQMSSPRQSPRQSMVLYTRSRNGTPKSVRSATARGSPRPRSRISEETDATLDGEQQHFPLVLLHVTLLPVDMPWSMESLQELLPSHVVENLQLLKSKVSETILSRGILISHPREEYELLEERLLEALELKSERVTKCGHFRSRDSTSSESDGGRDSDSGVGSSVDGSDGELCATCKHHIKTAKTAVGTGKKKWSVKVFAANGMMRASAWTAAWADMERVDVEVLPWIDEEVRRRLDERRDQEAAEARERLEDEDERIRGIVEEQVRVAHEEQRRRDEVERRAREKETGVREQASRPTTTSAATSNDKNPEESTSETKPKDIPQECHPTQIPVTTLLKNYIYLLAQDRRNVAILVLCLIAFLLAMRPARARELLPAREEHAELQPAISAQVFAMNDTAQIQEPSDQLGLSEASMNSNSTETSLGDAQEIVFVDNGTSTTGLVDLEFAAESEESTFVPTTEETLDQGIEVEQGDESSMIDSDPDALDLDSAVSAMEDVEGVEVRRDESTGSEGSMLGDYALAGKDEVEFDGPQESDKE